ncbi:hypothetical protein RIR_jg35469.t1 [Rhizophagus irregularis DAOM 181602=DAOM 197198]|uniref:Uncharacterized protein n=1 Tax=Rhizophagus irregularis (strain DAOM 181602 / DAOM 197198 / MUCL 43194) TaxID=747089 RepID=U9UYT7_RHIID|nr:hypothetical protein RIR_jg35469.t1 [Rhizophagus irregularis DAOM 181602=DAOM 197198]
MSIDIVHRWAKQMIKNHKNKNYYDNELFEDPLHGLLVRRLKNLQHTKTTLIIIGNLYQMHSLCLLAISGPDMKDNTIDVGRMFEVQVSKKGDFDIAEHLFVFNI